jgi:TRAP-type C4-dicarboxylate transport system substrate-binding protein
LSGFVLILLLIGLTGFVTACGKSTTETSATSVQTDTSTAATTAATTASVTETSAATPDTTSGPAAKAEYKLLFATYSSEKGFGSAGLRAFGEALEQKTNGRVEVEYSYSQALGKIPQYYDLLVNGTADVVFYSPYQTTGMFPLSEVATLPFIIPTSQIGSQAFAEVYRAGLLDERVYKETKTLFVCGDQGTNLRNSQRPVTELADCANMKIMIPGGELFSARAAAMGVVPVVITGTDVYPALEKGTIVGQLTGWAPLMQFKWCEVTSFATEPLIGGSPWIVGMNWDSYNKLPEDIRQIIDEMAQSDEYMMAAADGTQGLNETSRDCFISKGGQVTEWSAAALEQMGKNMAPVWEKWISDNEAKGLPARELVDAFYRALEKLGVSSPGVGYAPQS